MNSDTYEDIIHLPPHRSKKHPRISMAQRAAQFSSFSALTGYDDVVQEAARETSERIETDDEYRGELLRLLALAAERGDEAAVTYFRPDPRKRGGAYVQARGKVLLTEDGTAVISDGSRISPKDILDVEISGSSQP